MFSLVGRNRRSFLFLYFPSEVNLSTLFKWSFRVLVLASSNITRNRYDGETEFILYRGDQRRSGLNYARPCRECVDNIMRIFFPHECRWDADGWNEWIYNGGERFPRTSTRPPCVIFILRDTPSCKRVENQGPILPWAVLRSSLTYYSAL